MEQPKLRFIREDGTEYPEWEKGCLSDITKKVNRTAKEDSTAPIMMISQRNGFIHQSEKYSRDNAGKSLEKYTLLKYGEMAYNHGASKAKPYGVTFCLQEEKEARVPFVYHAFCIANGVPKYWNYALNTSQMDRQLKKMVSSGARMDGLLNINYDTYMQTKVFMPCLEEQQKIADFLSTVDEVISQSEAEVQNLEQQKKAAMQKIFSQEVRFRREGGTEFPEWEEKAITEICESILGGGTPTTENKDYWNGDIAWVSSSDLDNNDIHHLTITRFITEEAIRCSATKRIPRDSVLIVSRVGVGKVVVAPCELCTSQDFTNIVNPKCNSLFLGYMLSVIMQIKANGVQGTSIKGVTAKEINQYRISIPCLEEQQKIANFLSAYDEAIACAKQELDKWKELKKGLLQQMFV